MAFIGNTNTTQGFIPAIDYFNGNGSTTAFTLSRPVASVAQVQAVVNNVAQNPSDAFTVSSNTITFTSAPSSGTNNIYVYYTSPITQIIAPGQGTVTTTSLAGGTVTTTADATLNGLTVGKGGGSVSNNTAVGTGAMAATSTGDYNTAVGASSLAANTSGTQNTGIGRATLFTNTSGGYNFAGGLNSMYYNQSGASNTAVGTESMQANTTGGSNVAVGRQALIANTTASNNTAVGYQAGYTNQTGTFNTFIGQASGYYSNGSGNSANTCIGSYAGYNLSTGTGNTFIGSGTTYQSGTAITTGSKNTIIGAYNGNIGGLDIRTASNYVVLSDGDGNPKGYFGSSAYGEFTLNSSASQAYNGIFNFAESGTVKVQQYYQKNVTSFYVVNSSAGVYLGAGSTSWASASDERLKDIIEPIENGLTKVASLRAVIGKYKTDTEGTRRSFLIAQDVQAVLPEAISTTMVKDDNTEYLGVAYTDVIPLLVASIKELKTIVDTQAETINALTARIVALENK
jgi:hypothetical protein